MLFTDNLVPFIDHKYGKRIKRLLLLSNICMFDSKLGTDVIINKFETFRNILNSNASLSLSEKYNMLRHDIINITYKYINNIHLHLLQFNTEYVNFYIDISYL